MNLYLIKWLGFALYKSYIILINNHAYEYAKLYD